LGYRKQWDLQSDDFKRVAKIRSNLIGCVRIFTLNLFQSDRNSWSNAAELLCSAATSQRLQRKFRSACSVTACNMFLQPTVFSFEYWGRENAFTYECQTPRKFCRADLVITIGISRSQRVHCVKLKEIYNVIIIVSCYVTNADDGGK